MGNMYLAAAPAKGSSPIGYLVIAVLIGLFYVLIFRPQRKRQQAAAQTQSAVMPGQSVRTTAGIYGTVVSADERDVVIQIAPGVEIRMLRRAIMEVLPDEDGEAPADGTEASQEPRLDDTRSDDWDSGDRNA
jgi:preprotein translocase subunit YajC